jgi:hypothetical protein
MEAPSPAPVAEPLVEALPVIEFVFSQSENSEQADVAREETAQQLFRASSFAPQDVPSLSIAPFSRVSAPELRENSPEITLDLASLEASFRDTKAIDSPLETLSETSEAHVAAEPTSKITEIDIDLSAADTLLEFEEVVVRPKNSEAASPAPAAPPAAAPQSVAMGNWRQEMNEAIDDAVFRVIDRTLPTRIDTKIDAEIPAMLEKLSARCREEISQKLISRLEGQVGDAVRDWMKDNLVALVREEVRTELQRLLEGI